MKNVKASITKTVVGAFIIKLGKMTEFSTMNGEIVENLLKAVKNYNYFSFKSAS